MGRYRSMRMISAAVVFIFVLEARSWSVEPAPVWKVDVRQFGYESFPRRAVRPIQLFVDFSDNNHLAVAWISPDTTKSTQRKQPTWGEPAHLHLVLLDAKAGQKQDQKEWPTPYMNPLVVGIPDGKLLVCTENSLRLLSATLDVVQEKELPSHADCANTSFQASPSRRTLLVSLAHTRQVNVMDAATFRILFSWSEEGKAPISHTVASISDHWLVGYCGEPRELCVRRFDEPWHPFRATGVDTRMRVPASFITDEVLVVGGKSATLAAVNGTILFQIPLPKEHYFYRPPIPSSGGERFALLEGRLRGIRSEPLDMYPFYADDRVIVYGVKDQHSDFSLKLQGTSPWTPWHIINNTLGLSPDGRSLAVISDGVLQLYALTNGRPEPH
jgi:hypothetical protein